MLRNFRFTIGRKIYLIITLCFVCFIGVTIFETSELDAGLTRQKRIELKNLGDLALSVIKEEHDSARKAGLSDVEAQKRASARLRQLRYDEDEYFWIQDMHPRMIMHPASPDLEGKDISDLKDASGSRYTVAMSDIVKRNGRGTIEYDFAKPGSSKPQPKISYVVGYAPWGWVIGTGVYVDDLKDQIWQATSRALLITGVILLLVAAMSVIVARGVAKAMNGTTAAMRELAAGRLDVVLPGLGRKDEIGEIAAAVEAFKEKAIEKAEHEAREREERERLAAEERRSIEERESAQKKAADEKAAAERRAAMLKLAADFESAVGGIVDTVSSAATELEAAAATLTQTADTTQKLSSAVAAASEEASANVQSVASAAEEMSSSVHEIGRQVHESSRIAGQAVGQAEQTDGRINELSQAASRIGDVVKLITDIAEQTNLLALNATIEAARAGEAGKGFAVVAQEVKNLAAQTAKATGEIGGQIAGMQTATQDSVAAIKEIGTTIRHISEIAGTIAAAVEEQGSATGEITRNVQQAAHGTTEVARNIVDVNHGAAETGSASAQVLASARSLSQDSNRLKAELDRFLSTIRAA
ncbi:cache domain-containing protein [Astrobacterium formosum]|uniref:methyl-accepting chemotaxis protein n=1 Tax=Astrobacterium formosum TaxID=3069710 RepID=UPI003F5015BA